MSHNWYKGIRNATSGSTWHRQENAIAITDSDHMIDYAVNVENCWPEYVKKIPLYCDGLPVEGKFGVMAYYANGERKVVGDVGSVWSDVLDEWKAMVRAAGAAGAQPLMAYALVNKHKQPSKLLATFDVNHSDNNIKSCFTMVEGLDGNTPLLTGLSSIDVVCDNTLAMAWQRDGKEWAKIKHNGKAADRIALLRDIIPEVIRSGASVRELHTKAQQAKLTQTAFDSVFDQLWPKAKDDDTKRQHTRADNIRAEAMAACELDINKRDNAEGSLGTLWNAATWLNDRELDGSPRKTKGNSDPMINMLLGTRGKRVQAVQEIIQVAMADGSYETMSVDTAQAYGVDDGQIGASLLSDMLGGE